MRRLNPLLICWLQTWGTCQQRKIGLEYPSITAEARLLHSPGRSTFSNRSPSYEPNPIDTMVANAVRQIENREHALLLVYRYIEGKSYSDIQKEINIKSEKAARWAVEKAIRAIAEVLGVPTYM